MQWLIRCLRSETPEPKALSYFTYKETYFPSNNIASTDQHWRDNAWKCRVSAQMRAVCQYHKISTVGQALRSKYKVKSPTFSDIMPCSLLIVNQHSRRIHCPHYPSQRNTTEKFQILQRIRFILTSSAVVLWNIGTYSSAFYRKRGCHGTTKKHWGFSWYIAQNLCWKTSSCSASAEISCLVGNRGLLPECTWDSFTVMTVKSMLFGV